MAGKTYNINLFFYIKGSKDFPSGHGIDEKFGFSEASYSKITHNQGEINTGYLTVGTEVPIFKTTIRDIFNKNSSRNSETVSIGPREIENTYSLFSDESNGIFNQLNNSGSFSSGGNARNERSIEYLSTMIVKPSIDSNNDKRNEENNLYRQIYPNYSYNSKEQFDYLLGISSSQGNSIDMPPRRSMFWQKVFTLLEFLKKQESVILTNDSNSQMQFPEEYTNHKSDWWSANDTSNAALESYLNQENALGQYIALFVGKLSGVNDDNIIQNCISQNYNVSVGQGTNQKTYYTNPLRNTFITGTNTPKDTVNGIPDVSVIQDNLWSELDITYIAKSAKFERSQYDGRIKYMYFTLLFKQYSDTINTNYEQWNFKIYFDPDGFVEDTTNNQFEVWTYNDLDLDEQYEMGNGFNKYDNDYANMLRPQSDTRRGHFIATESEVKESMANAILNIMQGNEFTGFKEFTCLRVSPEIKIVEEGDKRYHTVEWPSINSNENPDAHGIGMQTFYVFYNTVEPTPSQIKSAVMKYLKGLHSGCAAETYYNAGGTDVGVQFIGHDGTNETETTNFLAKMYPDLFTSTVVYIIPPYYTLCENYRDNPENLYKPEKYFHTTSQKRLLKTIRMSESTNIDSKFGQFEFNPNGDIILPATSGEIRKTFGTEIFYIGGLNNEQPNDTNGWQFPAPFVAIMESGELNEPLTSQTGFASYYPHFFNHNVSPANPADLLQFIIIKLMKCMFQEPSSQPKLKLNPIAGVNISYESDRTADPTVTDRQVCNLAEFTINGIVFRVYAQKNKYFCDLNASEVADGN